MPVSFSKKHKSKQTIIFKHSSNRKTEPFVPVQSRISDNYQNKEANKLSKLTFLN